VRRTVSVAIRAAVPARPGIPATASVMGLPVSSTMRGVQVEGHCGLHELLLGHVQVMRTTGDQPAALRGGFNSDLPGRLLHHRHRRKIGYGSHALLSIRGRRFYRRSANAPGSSLSTLDQVTCDFLSHGTMVDRQPLVIPFTVSRVIEPDRCL